MTTANDETVSSHPPSNDTYVKSPLYYDEGNDDNVNSTSTLGDKAFLIQEGKKPRKLRKFRKKGLLQSLPSFILQKRLINLRSVLLATSLALILLSFWLLDSLKDPTFAVMVEGNLHKHQPLAKMASVGGTLILVILMEVVSNGRENKRKDMLSKEEIERQGECIRHDGITRNRQTPLYFFDFRLFFMIPFLLQTN